jgi:hypothetical protein
MWLAIGMVVVLVGLAVFVRRSRMRQHQGNIMVPCSLVAVSVLFLVLSLEFPVQEGVGPRVIPQLWCYLILILSAIVLAKALRGKEAVPPKVEQMGLMVKVTAALIGYFVGMYYLGYYLSTFLFIVLLLHILSYQRKFFSYVAIAGGWVLFSYLVFYKTLYTQLPLGIFEGMF